MIRLRTIDNFDLPELRPYRTMRRQQEHRNEGIFVAEGEKVVRRLLESPLQVISVLLPQKWYEDLRPILERRPEPIDVFVADKKLLETMTGFSMYQGLLALARVPPPAQLQDVLGFTSRPLLLGVTEGLSSAENLGSVVRNCAAFSAHGVLVGETCASPFLRRAVRSSMGTVFEIPVVESVDLTADLAWLKSRGVLLIAAHPHVSGRTISAADFKHDCAIIFGSEGYGISPAVLTLCDDAVAIPMPPRVDSLNVGSAAAAFLFEANRQRGRM
jgi:tRNA G18 (ribose-2'-O)-methylase SpoU